jgi:hypothetical protein
MRPRSLLLPFILLAIAAQAQQWSGIIAPGRAIDWSQVGIPAGIPDRARICATLNPGVTAGQINAAIASCPKGQVVYLKAGTYQLAGGIDFADHSNITLRGAGPAQTILVFRSGSACGGPNADVCIEGSFNWSGGPQHLTTWTAGYSSGTSKITLGSVSGLSVGQVLILDQANDLLDTGQVFVCDNESADSSHTGCDSGGNTRAPGRVVDGVDYGQQQYVRVTAINGNKVTISPGLYMPNWRSSQTPGAWWATSSIKMSGIENMTLDHTRSNETSGTMFFNAYECWVKNVRSLNANRNHVWLQYSAKSVVRDSYFYGTLNAQSESYGVETWQSGDILVENNIFEHVTNPILHGNTSGSVFAYNFSTNDYYQNASWMMPAVMSHDTGTAMDLFEGNEGDAFEEDSIHGTHNFATVFRNQYTGVEPGKTQQTIPIQLQSHTRYDNIVGNVLGATPYHRSYQFSAPAVITPACDRSIYVLGYALKCGRDATVPPDPLVSATLMRWGNYDTVNGTAQWNPNEVPQALNQFANPLPSNHNLPASFYLSSKPGWWGTMPWPAIGPDVSGGSDPSGHVYLNPAQTCYHNGTFTDGVLNFDASNCYR